MRGAEPSEPPRPPSHRGQPALTAPHRTAPRCTAPRRAAPHCTQPHRVSLHARIVSPRSFEGRLAKIQELIDVRTVLTTDEELKRCQAR